MSPVDGVVAKEAVDETEGALLLWGLGNIGPLGIQPGLFYRSRTRTGLGMESVAEVWRYGGHDATCWPRLAPSSTIFSVVFSKTGTLV